MHKAIDIANFFVNLSSAADEELMTNLKVNKLVYFAQAWSLVRFNKKLFDEDILAWQYGPVVQSVYNTFKPCGKNNIANVAGNYSEDKFSEDELALLIDVAMQYGQFTAPKLVDITHKKNSPWSKVYKEHESNVISIESIKEYFSNLKPMQSFSFDVNENEFIGYRDSEGYLVLPKEWDDGE